jgi:hypothetical protein
MTSRKAMSSGGNRMTLSATTLPPLRCCLYCAAGTR